MRLRTWRRAMFAAGAVLLVAGAVLMVGGGLAAGRAQYGNGGDVMAGIWTGTVGTLFVVTGVVLLKLAAFGPVPESMRHELPVREVEVDD